VHYIYWAIKSRYTQFYSQINYNAEVFNDLVMPDTNYKNVSDICVTVLRRHNNINSQLDATITNFIDNYKQLNTFRSIISPIIRSTRLCLQLVV